MTVSKRILDIVLVLVLAIFLVPVVIVVSLALLVRQGRPVFFVSERMKGARHGFSLWKFRTMDTSKDDLKASGGHKDTRITPMGRWMRKYRVDELPQLWNIFVGDMSFVGPRPPLRRYVEMFPDTYGKVLQCRPGVTGLATLLYHKEEERLLLECDSAQETEHIYTTRCIPRKAQLDLIYARRRTICLDLRLIIATAYRKLPPVPRRPRT